MRSKYFTFEKYSIAILVKCFSIRKPDYSVTNDRKILNSC